MRWMSVRFKLLASITVCTLALGAGVYWYMTRAAADQTVSTAAEEGRRLTTQLEEVRGYYADHVASVCRKQGMEVVPCGCEYRILDFEIGPSSFLPQPGAARGCQRAMHEWLGLAWYWLRGRI